MSSPRAFYQRVAPEPVCVDEERPMRARDVDQERKNGTALSQDRDRSWAVDRGENPGPQAAATDKPSCGWGCAVVPIRTGRLRSPRGSGPALTVASTLSTAGRRIRRRSSGYLHVIHTGARGCPHSRWGGRRSPPAMYARCDRFPLVRGYWNFWKMISWRIASSPNELRQFGPGVRNSPMFGRKPR
jgi:hypothetical protein